MADREKVIERLGKVSYYFKSLLAVGWQGDADIYREHMESVNMAIALLKEQPEIVRCKDCTHWIPGKITDKDDFAQHRCKRNGGKWSADEYCSCAERVEV